VESFALLHPLSLKEKTMFDLILRNARLVDDTVIDIALKDGKIAALGEVTGEAQDERQLNGEYYVSAGWIDSHVHCYQKSPIYHDEPDSIGINTGVTTVVDAGSTGADDIDEFYEITRKAATDVYALLNISRVGLIAQNELSDMANIDKVAVRDALKRHPGFIVGIKARMSSSVVGANGIKPLERAKEIRRENGDLPLMVHIGNNPPDLDEIADLLTSGDIITHCYNGKPNRILAPGGELRASISNAIARGVRLDVGHGSASFSFEVAKIAIGQGIFPHTISSDIYCRNRINGPVHSLGAVMSKFLSIGMSLPQVIDCVTEQAADGLRLANKGRLSVGLDGDLTIFALRRQPTVFVDSEQQTLTGEQLLVALAAVRAGKWFTTEQGKAEHVFNL
jgi:dihydroorotase